MKITKRQREVIALFAEPGMTQEKAASRLQISQPAISKHLKLLKKKGVIFNGYNDGYKNPMVSLSQPKRNETALSDTEPIQKIRLHNVEFNIRPYHFTPKYDEERQRNNRFKFRGFVIRLYEKSIEVYSGKALMWIDDNVQAAFAQMEDVFDAMIRKLEFRLGIKIFKDEKMNIRLVNCHIAFVNSSLADKKMVGDKLTIYGRDGKVWFLVDHSFNLDEAECVHPTESKVDAGIVEQHLQDWREYPEMPKQSEMWRFISASVKGQHEFATQLRVHLSVLKELAQGVRELREAVKEKR